MIEEKIAKFRELIARRDEIDAELRALLGEEEPDREPEQIAPPRQRAPKEPRSEIEHHTEPKRQRGEPCEDCGSKGTRHYKGCPQSAASKGAAQVPHTPGGKTILDESEKISASDWSEIKEQHNDGIALDMMKLSYPQYGPMEVRKAVKFDTYDDYLAG